MIGKVMFFSKRFWRTYNVPAIFLSVMWVLFIFRILERPKSAILALYCSSSNIFSGLISQWMILWSEPWWRKQRPLATPFIILNRFSQLRAWRFISSVRINKSLICTNQSFKYINLFEFFVGWKNKNFDKWNWNSGKKG